MAGRRESRGGVWSLVRTTDSRSHVYSTADPCPNTDPHMKRPALAPASAAAQPSFFGAQVGGGRHAAKVLLAAGREMCTVRMSRGAQCKDLELLSHSPVWASSKC